MPLSRIQIPLGGKSETAPYSAQEPYTCREEENVRSQDRVTGRMRLSQRPGLSNFNSSALNGVNKVADLAHVTYDNRKVTYTQHGDGEETVLWGKKTPSGEDSLGGTIDPRNGDVFALDGPSAIIVFNPDGAEVYRFVFPVEDDKHVIRALTVDEFGCVFAGVSTGGVQGTARVWKYEPDPEEVSPLKLVFELTLDAYCEKIRIVGDKMYLALNQPDRARSFVRAYSLVGRQAIESFSQEVSFPINDLAVRDDGSFAIASPEFGDDIDTFFRGPNPRAAEYSPVVSDWTPRDDEDLRIWSWYDATTIDEMDVVGGILEEGAELRRWRDVSGNDRHFFADLGRGDAPTFTFAGIADRPSVKFVYDGTTGQGLVSGSNPGITKATADKHRSAIPSYTDSMYAAFMVLLPRVGSDASQFSFPLYQQNTDGGDDEFIAVNRDDNSSQASGYFAGRISYNTEATSTGYNPHGSGSVVPINGQFLTQPTGAIIVAWINDGGIDSTPAHDTVTRSVFYVDGDVIDRWHSDPRTSTRPVYMGSNLVDLNSGSEPYNGLIAELIVLDRLDRNDDVTEPKILSHDFYGTEPGVNDTPNSDYSPNQFNRIIGYLAHKWGKAKDLPTDSDTRPHPYGLDESGTFPLAGPPGLTSATDGLNSPYAQLISRFPLLAKFGSSGELLWVYNQITTTETGTNRGAAGYGVIYGTDDDIFSMGPSISNTSVSRAFVRKLIDNGSSFSDRQADGAWRAVVSTDAQNIDYEYPIMDVDEFGNVYVPFYESSAAASSLRIYDKTGSAGSGVLLVDYLLPNSKLGTGVRINPFVPDYDGNATTVDLAEHVYIFSTNEGNSLRAVVTKLELVEVTARSGSSRSMTLVGVAGGAIRIVTSGAISAPSGSPTLSSSADYIQSVTAFERVYFTDGIRYRVFDPKDSSAATWESAKGGSIPRRCRLIELWRGRIFLGRDPEDPHDWHMSRIGDPTDWNEYPPDITPDQPISGTNPFNGPGVSPDIINAFVPVDEDTALFGGDHSLHILAGDPMAGGGIDLLSEITGMAFGRPWCKDPEGRVYFMGSRGGLYTWAPGGGVERLSLYRLERELSEIDLSTYYWRLAYDARQEGIIMSIFPFGSGGTAHNGWFFDLKTGRVLGDSVFHVDSWALTTLQPTAMIVVDGDDPDDRRVLVGCEDGKVRIIDETQSGDGTARIDAFVTIGPLAVPDGNELKVTRLEIALADDQQGTIYQLFATDDPDVLGSPVDQGTLRPGYNVVHVRARGSYLYLRLRNALASQSFSVETIQVNLEQAGRRRVYTP